MATNIDRVVCKDTSTYMGKIVTSAKYDPPNSIRMTTDIEDFPFRVITKRMIASINGEHINYVEQLESTRTVTGSDGTIYTVKTVNGKTTCTCPGFAWRHNCKHLGA